MSSASSDPIEMDPLDEERPLGGTSKKKRLVRYTDEDGLSAAYRSVDGVFVDGHRMFIAGTSGLRDALEDLTIPFTRNVQITKRYRDARDRLDKSPHIREIIGHSLGGSVANDLSKERQIAARLYSAPVNFNLSPFAEHYSTRFDPIAWFSAKRQTPSSSSGWNPHSYRNVPEAKRTRYDEVDDEDDI